MVLASKMVQVDLQLCRMSQMLVDIQLHSKRLSCLWYVSSRYVIIFQALTTISM